MNQRRRYLLRSPVLLLVLAMSAPAMAEEDIEPPKRAEARVLFDEGTSLAQQGRHLEACPKLAASHKLDPGMGVLFRLAQCYEATGKFASAWVTYVEVAEMALAAKRTDREAHARAQADRIKLKVPKMLLLVPDEVRAIKGVEVKRDGQVVPKESWGTAIPVDGGAHVISVRAPGYREWSTTVNVSATGDGGTMTVSVASPSAEPEVGPIQPVLVDGGGWSTAKIAGIAVAGAGAATLIVGGVLGGLAIGKDNDAKKLCRPEDPSLCTAEGVALDGDVKTLGTASTVTMVVGGLLAVGGAVLFFVAPSSSPAPKTGKTGSNAQMRMGVSAGRIVLEGSW